MLLNLTHWTFKNTILKFLISSLWNAQNIHCKSVICKTLKVKFALLRVLAFGLQRHRRESMVQKQLNRCVSILTCCKNNLKLFLARPTNPLAPLGPMFDRLNELLPWTNICHLQHRLPDNLTILKVGVWRGASVPHLPKIPMSPAGTSHFAPEASFRLVYFNIHYLGFTIFIF